ncbi:Homeodomain-like protein [Cynara cardunculus var. scolymus]|uniref:Homeodomain-like protein n=1 Tax=Cynara cardunculus var. scolymus TaxID=59895 RepID=A0A118JWU4_CYNCS|nr:Homeodomain-like protein [Cynara cardunculus var. scolymus]
MVKTPSFDKNGVKKGAWSEDEDNKLRAYVQRYGHWNWRLLPKFAGMSHFPEWSEMAAYLPGRSDNEIKNRWHTHLKKRAQKDQTELENEHIGTVEPDQTNNTEENLVQNSDLQLQQDIEILLAESPLSSSTTNLSWLNGFDSAGSSDDIPQLTDYAPVGDFWTDPFFSDNDSIISSSDNLFLPSDLVYTASCQDMIVADDEFLWSSLDSYLEYNGQFIN